MNFQDALTEASRFHDQPKGRWEQAISVAITTNQRGWTGQPGSSKTGMIVSYAHGQLTYVRPASHTPSAKLWGWFETSRGAYLPYMFDNRGSHWPGQPGGGGSFGTLGTPQPFDSRQADKLGFSIIGDPANPTATFTLHSWNDARFEVELTPLGDILVGTGPAIGNSAGTQTAVYTVAFEISYNLLPA